MQIGFSGAFEGEEDAICRLVELITCVPSLEETKHEIGDRLKFAEQKLTASQSKLLAVNFEKLRLGIESTHEARDLLRRMRMKMLAAYTFDNASFRDDMDRILEVAFYSGALTGSLVALNPVEKTKAQRDAPDAARARGSRQKAHQARRKAGEPIRRVAYEHCIAYPKTTQGECVKKICATLLDVKTENATARIRDAFERVSGSRQKHLKPGWRQILGDNDL